MAEEKLESAGHERGVVVHDEVEEDSQEHAPALTVQIELGRFITATRKPQGQVRL